MMHRQRLLLFLAALLAVVAVYYQRKDPAKVVSNPHPRRNNSVLFLSNGDAGFANVVLAASYSLMVDHSDLEIHYGTSKTFENPIKDVNKWAAAKSADTRAIEFHALKSHDFAQAFGEGGKGFEYAINAPGLAGIKIFYSKFHNFMMPWQPPEYLALYKEAIAMITEVDPAVVVLDPLFSPGIDAVRALARPEVIVSPNSVKDVFADQQPWMSMFWKYPFLSTGCRYPVKWSQVPANAYIMLRLAYSSFYDPVLVSKRGWLKEHGIANPLDFAFLYNKDVTFLLGGSLEAEFPMSVIPGNAVLCGPIYLSSAPVSEQDPKLAKWLKRAPIVLINLGSRTTFTADGAREIVKALKKVLDTTSVQILWKFNKRGSYSDDFLSDVSHELANGRLRLEKWLVADPASILETGNVVLFIHHGGANCYQESVGTGVPQLVLPMWADCYDYATRAEYLGIGVWANERAAPYWTSDELDVAFSRVLGNGTEATSIKKKAAALGKIHQDRIPGRSVAASEIARLARL